MQRDVLGDQASFLGSWALAARGSVSSRDYLYGRGMANLTPPKKPFKRDRSVEGVGCPRRCLIKECPLPAFDLSGSLAYSFVSQTVCFPLSSLIFSLNSQRKFYQAPQPETTYQHAFPKPSTLCRENLRGHARW